MNEIDLPIHNQNILNLSILLIRSSLEQIPNNPIIPLIGMHIHIPIEFIKTNSLRINRPRLQFLEHIELGVFLSDPLQGLTQRPQRFRLSRATPTEHQHPIVHHHHRMDIDHFGNLGVTDLQIIVFHHLLADLYKVLILFLFKGDPREKIVDHIVEQLYICGHQTRQNHPLHSRDQDQTFLLLGLVKDLAGSH